MKKLALLAGVGLLAFGSIDTAEAQRGNRDGGFRHGGHWRHHHHYGYRYNTGGALAAGFVGGALLGGLATAAAAPYGYGYPAYGYGVGYPVASTYVAPAYETRIVYRQPTVRTRVVYRTAPAVRRTRVVYRQAPVVRQRIVYQQPRARIVSQPAYSTRVTYRQNQRGRVAVRSTVRRDVMSTGTIRDGRGWR